ncbi:MAG: Cupin 2 conserved barrel domain protein [Acidobacteriaceae bacterium]|nr:Cupin 2 conserved barrel domain protein [Acidobacteriaceae bacterium]
MSSPTQYRWSDIEIEQLNPLLQRQFLHGTEAMLTRFHLAKSCIVPLHSHPNEQISFIVTGSLEFDFGAGDTRIVRSGEVLVIPRDLPHSAVALEDTLAFDVFAPPRQDWIDKTDAYLR